MEHRAFFALDVAAAALMGSAAILLLVCALKLLF
jgi:hypothetical protein